jgi:hypothetical protein
MPSLSSFDGGCENDTVANLLFPILSTSQTKGASMTTPLVVTVETKALGQSARLRSSSHVDLSSLASVSPLPLRTLLAALVRSEVQAFAERQAQRAVLQVMTSKQIVEDASHGKIVPQGAMPQEVDVDDAIAAALQVFEDRLYLVVIDGQPVDALDATVRLRPDSHITLVRLVALIGG